MRDKRVKARRVLLIGLIAVALVPVAWRTEYEARLGGEGGAALWAKVEALYSNDQARDRWNH